eukprot:TRINITY_DN1820_c0_g2_i2.p3 TRINITY_DN1820_c0_g2~~TRINITY_DN1820_c0_g2_i2.p3  ORF type:complete len:106 (-),score=4.83 TRINITY_DN1820_c0_g2_i2:8-325(-)
MRLYRRADVQELCLQTYGSPQGLAEKLAKNAATAAKRRATLAANPPAPRYDAEESQKDREHSENSAVCRGCGNTAARECDNDMCCHCCKEATYGFKGSCFRHTGF